MKKRIERISLIVFLLIILWNNFCYADMVSPAVNLGASLISLTWVGIVIIGLAVLIISIISFFILHIYSSIETENEKQENMEKIHKNNRRIYVSAIVLAIMSHLLLQGIFRASIWIFFFFFFF